MGACSRRKGNDYDSKIRGITGKEIDPEERREEELELERNIESFLYRYSGSRSPPPASDRSPSLSPTPTSNGASRFGSVAAEGREKESLTVPEVSRTGDSVSDDALDIKTPVKTSDGQEEKTLVAKALDKPGDSTCDGTPNSLGDTAYTSVNHTSVAGGSIAPTSALTKVQGEDQARHTIMIPDDMNLLKTESPSQSLFPPTSAQVSSFTSAAFFATQQHADVGVLRSIINDLLVSKSRTESEIRSLRAEMHLLRTASTVYTDPNAAVRLVSRLEAAETRITTLEKEVLVDLGTKQEGGLCHGGVLGELMGKVEKLQKRETDYGTRLAAAVMKFAQDLQSRYN
jgi:hypothetical protein